MDPAIQVTGLQVTRARRKILRDLSFEVAAGAVTGLVGPSGGGKTTLMRCVVGAQRISRGEVRVLGQPAGSAALRRRVGYVTQAPSVYADLSVQENARYFAAVQGRSRRAADQAVVDVGLGSAAAQLVGSLSGGQRARASLACALLADPDVLVLDEPTVGQDPVLRHDLWQRFADLAAGGATLLVSSHVMDEAARCDRVLLLRDGRLLADDTPAGLRARTGATDMDGAFLRLVRDTEMETV
ncbi:MAG: ABC transporter ATP-binding protein [Actinocatenispora sp.]